ncbi:hypothetical protein [Aggregatibacter sp.]
MTTQTIQQLLTDFATYLGEQDKALYQQLEAKINQLKADLLGGEVSADLDTFRELAEELRKLKASGSTIPEALITKMTEFKQSLDDVIEKLNALTVVLDRGRPDKPTTSGQISVLELQTVVPSAIHYPEDETKLASGDYVVDTNNNDLIIQVGKQYAGWEVHDEKVNEEGLLKLHNFVSHQGEVIKLTLKSPVNVTSVLYNNIRKVDLNRLVSVTDVTYKFENNTLSELKLHGVLENGKAVSRYLNQNTDYVRIVQYHSSGFASTIDSSYGGEPDKRFFGQHGEKPSESYHIPEGVDYIELTINHNDFSKTITLHKETPKT